MDKNFVNIDDLVRQRLGGGEEREKAGAWLQMRDLLDKEMPERKGGFLFWRRMFSALGIIAAISTIGAGSYYLSSSKEFGFNDGEVAYATVAQPGDASEGSSELIRNLNAAKDTRDGGSTGVYASAPNKSNTSQHWAANGPREVSQHGAGAQHLLASNSATPAGANVTDNNLQANNAIPNGDAAAANQQNRPQRNSAGNKQTLMKLLAENGIDIHKPVEHENGKPTGDLYAASTDEKTNGSSASNTSSNRIRNNNNTKNNNHTSYANNTRTSNPTRTATGDNNTRTGSTDGVATTNNTGNTGATDLANNRNHRNSNRHGNRRPASNILSSGSNGDAINATGVAALDGDKGSRTGTDGTAARNGNRNGHSGLATASNSTSTGSRRHGGSSATSATHRRGHGSSAINGSDNVLASNTPANGSRVRNVPGTAGTDAAIAAAKQDQNGGSVSRGKRVIEKIVMLEHYVKTAPDDGYYKLDTLSMETITRDIMSNVPGSSDEGTALVRADRSAAEPDETATTGNKKNNKNAGTIASRKQKGNASADNNAIAAAGEPAGKNGRKASGTTGGTTGGGKSAGSASGLASNSVSPKNAGGMTDENTEEVADVNSPSLASTATIASEKAGLSKKETGKKSTPSTAEKLNETFNDIKYKVTGMKVGAGITAGINSTFFGPNSFKGFQFGATCNFQFDETWSFLTELKYFHRVNNDFSIEDNYYNVTTASGSNMSTKEHRLKSYAFSSLQSIEMPLSLHYAKGRFTFFGGANVVYSFAINTGAMETVDVNNPPAVVPTSSINPAEVEQKLAAKDFESRIGLGYLVGLSYEVAPNVTLDFRNVQNVWDNAPSSGSKLVSSKLYMSPSFQVSFGYRFGGKKKD